MSLQTSLESPWDTLRWLAGEGAVIVGVVLFWTGVALAMWIGVSVLRALLGVVGLERVGEPFYLSYFLRQTVTLVIVATVALYVLVRAGTVLIERYRRAPTDDRFRGDSLE